MYRYVFLTLALVEGEWSASRPGSFIPEEEIPHTHRIGGWVGPRAGLDDTKKWKFSTLPGPELRLLGGPAGSQSNNCEMDSSIKFTRRDILHINITKGGKLICLYSVSEIPHWGKGESEVVPVPNH
jgi:hypothetical protein